MLEWIEDSQYPIIYAESSAASGGKFYIFYDDIMYWDRFSGLSPTQDLDAIKAKAQELHNLYK